MFTNNNRKQFDLRYFTLIEYSPYQVVLRSKNTFHYWKIFYDQKNNKYILYHSHQGNCNYHEQQRFMNLAAATNYIKKHDKFQLSSRAKEDNDYDYIPLLENEDYFIF